MAVRLKRAYEQPESSGGYRVLIDRLWPRGLKNDQVQLDEWARELARSRRQARESALLAQVATSLLERGSVSAELPHARRRARMTESIATPRCA